MDTDTRHKNGYIGNICRGSLPEALDAKVFGAEPGDLLGPLQRGEGMFFEIFRIDAKHTAHLDHDTEEKIKQILFQEWLQERAQEHRVEVV